MRQLLLVACLLIPAGGAWGQTYLGKGVEAWRQRLASPRPAERCSAAFALGQLGPAAAAAVPDLARLLAADPDPGVRAMAAQAIGDVAGTAAATARPALETALGRDTDGRVRRACAYALGALGPAGVPSAPALRRALRDAEAPVRQNAAWALGLLARDADTVEALRRLLTDDDALVRRDAAGALEAIGKPAALPAVSALFALARRKSDDVARNAALNALTRLAGPEHRASLPDLAPLLSGSDAEAARMAAFILVNIKEGDAPETLPVLRAALADDEPIVQELAAGALARLGPRAAPAVEELARALAPGRAVHVRRNAALALAAIGPKARAAVPALTTALRPPGPGSVRRYVAEALARVGYPANEPALPIMVEAIAHDPEPRVRTSCAFAMFRVRDLERHGVDRALAAVLTERGEDTRLLRYTAARVLAFHLRERAPERTADVLVEMLGDRNLLIYNGSAAPVVGGGAESARGQVNVKANLGGDARFMAAAALAWMGGKATARPTVVAALRTASRDSDQRLRTEAERALKALRVAK